MKVLTHGKQQRLMTLICKAQKSVDCGDFCKVTDLLAEIAGEVLTITQLWVLKDEICKMGNTKMNIFKIEFKRSCPMMVKCIDAKVSKKGVTIIGGERDGITYCDACAATLVAADTIKEEREMTTIAMLEKAFWKLTNSYNIKYYNAIEEELRILEILRKHMKWQGSLQYVLSISKYWEEECKRVTQEMLDDYDFPFTVDEFEMIAKWLRKKEQQE